MSIFVTATGFQKKTLAELKLEYEALFKTAFGDDIDIDPDSGFGQIIGILSKRDADLWDGAEEIYNSRNPNEAAGVSLDNISAETGVRRIDATETQVDNVFLFGTEGTIVAAGKQVRQENSESLFSLETEVEITKAVAVFVALSVSDPSAGGIVYEVEIDGTTYTYTSSPGDTEGDVINELVDDITAGSWGGTASNFDDTELQIQWNDEPSIIDWNAEMTLETLASPGRFLCNDTGPIAVPSNTLTVIVTPVSGWDSVNNPVAGLTGRDTETDSALRLRRQQMLLSGNATDEAIRSALLSEVDGVASATVVSNRTMATDGEGRPPKSFEAIVEGGSDPDVAEKIWNIMPSGIETYGNTSESVTDSQGIVQTINFSRPESVDIYVNVKRDLYDEEIYPADGDAQIKAAIVAWAIINQTIGKDVIRQRLSIPIYSIAGISDTVIELSEDGITYTEADIDIAAREIASFATARISVEDLTP